MLVVAIASSSRSAVVVGVLPLLLLSIPHLKNLSEPICKIQEHVEVDDGECARQRFVKVFQIGTPSANMGRRGCRVMTG